MSEHSMTKPQVGANTSAAVTGILLAAAAVAVVFGCSLAFLAEDTEPLESPLMLSVARQLVRGPRELYGPFSRINPLVIIHAPLYYRLAALLAWLLYSAGLDPVPAALAAGRSISLLGLAWTVAIAYRLACFDGGPPRVGWWAAFLIAACPAVGVIPYTVRPDMLGVALQTTGVFLVLSALRSKRPHQVMLAAGFAIFGLAFCVKQQLVAAPAISMLLVMRAWLRGRVSSNHVAVAFLTYAAIALGVYGTEELVTRGEMSQSVFRAAFAVSRVHPADLFRAVLVLHAIFARSTGLIALLLAASVAGVGTLRGIVRPGIVVVGSLLLGLITLGALLSALSLAVSRWDPALTLACLMVTVIIVIPASCLLSPRIVVAERIDRVMWIYVTAELGLVAILSWMSTGAWVNYGVQAVVFASIPIARALGRALEQAQSHRQVVPISVAALVLLIGASGNVETTLRHRRYEQVALDRVFERLGRPPTNRFFFAARPGHNRVYGRTDMVFDDWLYPVFESIHQAEPRSSWLRQALASDAIDFVVTTSDSPEINGLGETLPRLGYVSDFKLGPFYLWEHFRFGKAARSR